MNFKRAAYKVLKKVQRPLSAKEITELALKEKLITTKGATPEATMAAQIYIDIKVKKEKSVFTKTGRGLFNLRNPNQELESETNKIEYPGFARE
jgi:hypothetical protein